MATSGTGRGRGWLKINKNSVTTPGQLPNGMLSSSTPPDVQSVVAPASRTSTTPHQEYAKLFSIIYKLNNVDDGILMNQKFKVIIETWMQDCPTSNQAEDSVKCMYQKCLEDEVFAMKVVTMIVSNTFSQLEIAEQKIRKLFIGHIQESYDNRKALQQSQPNSFRISVRILGEFYNKARLSTGKQISLLVEPLLSCLEMLLESAQPADIELFTSQLCINGAAIKSEREQHQQLNNILNKARQMLVCNFQLPQMSKLILLLAIDFSNNRFALLPPDVLRFYQEELGDKVMANFQGSLGALSIQTQQSNKTLDSYQSTVSVLQVTPPDSTSPIGESAPAPTAKSHPQPHQSTQQPNTATTTQRAHNNATQPLYSNNNTTSYNNDSTINVGDWDAKKKAPSVRNRQKTGRPILGAGARFQKDTQSENRNMNWGGSNWTEKKTKNYGWEHDDRFETDYQ